MTRGPRNIEAEWRARVDAFGEVLDLIADSDRDWQWLTHAVTKKLNQAIAFERSYKQEQSNGTEKGGMCADRSS